MNYKNELFIAVSTVVIIAVICLGLLARKNEQQRGVKLTPVENVKDIDKNMIKMSTTTKVEMPKGSFID